MAPPDRLETNSDFARAKRAGKISSEQLIIVRAMSRKSHRSHHKRNVFCLPRQKTFFLAFWGILQQKSHKMRQNGLRDGLMDCFGALFCVSGIENGSKMLVYFLRFFALQRSRQSTARGDLNTNFAYAIYENCNNKLNTLC